MVLYSELLSTRRSVREYQDRTVPLEVLHEIIGESCLAPSASNRQPWHFIIVNSKAWISRLSRESKSNLLRELDGNPSALLRKYEPILRDDSFNVFYNAPCLVYIAGSEDIRSLDLDCALAASYFMFSAAARGLGTCWVALGSRIVDPGLRSELGLRDDFRIVAPIIVGYPKRVPACPERNAPQILKVIT